MSIKTRKGSGFGQRLFHPASLCLSATTTIAPLEPLIIEAQGVSPIGRLPFQP
ncbi:MAG: hypothetical protein KAR15_04305 [Desulfobacterales bacterium]|jgi:hypothetical protein|nr:hypothetical protein [Desulfobacterales bacterium]